MTPLDRIRIVLVEPRDAGNVGATARAMKNMGLTRLVLASAPALDTKRAARMAVHARDVLDARVTAPDLPAAVADAGLVVGTSGRATSQRDGGRAPRTVAAEIVAAARTNDVALVFGPEDRGLSNSELAHCQSFITIPTDTAYGSLNLAQSVLLCAYEMFLATGEVVPAPTRSLATSARHELMYEKLETSLLAVGFLQRDTADSMMRKLRRTLGRAELDDDEVQVFLGMARQMSWAATRRRED